MLIVPRISLNDFPSIDPLMSECLIYQLKPGQTMVCLSAQNPEFNYELIDHHQVGRLDSEKPAAIRLSGESINEEHCYFENNDGKVTLHAIGEAVTVRLPTRNERETFLSVGLSS